MLYYSFSSDLSFSEDHSPTCWQTDHIELFPMDVFHHEKGNNLSSLVDIYFSKHFHALMIMILPALPYKILLNALLAVMIFCTCFQRTDFVAKERWHCTHTHKITAQTTHFNTESFKSYLA